MVRPISEQSRHFQSLSVTILAIATATIGFGLFGADFRVIASLPELHGPVLFWAVLKLVCGAGAMIGYASVVVAVGRILTQETSLTGRQVTLSALLLTGVVMVFVAFIFIIGVFEENPDILPEAEKK